MTQTMFLDELVIDPRKMGAFVLDVEDVVLRLAPLRREGWCKAVDGILQISGGETGVTSDELDEMLSHDVTNQSILELLTKRGVSLPVGDSHHPPEQPSIWGLRNLAELEFHSLLRKRGSEVLAAVRVVRQLYQVGIPLVAYSEEKVRLPLWLLGIERWFIAVLDASASEWLDVPQLARTDALMLAGEIAGVEPEETALITTDPELAEAGQRAGLGLVVGLNSTGNGERLVRSGADLVLENLEQEFVVILYSPL